MIGTQHTNKATGRTVTIVERAQGRQTFSKPVVWKVVDETGRVTYPSDATLRRNYRPQHFIGLTVLDRGEHSVIATPDGLAFHPPVDSDVVLCA